MIMKYSIGDIERKLADDILLEAMTLTGVSYWKREAIYAGVRVGGASHYGTS